MQVALKYEPFDFLPFQVSVCVCVCVRVCVCTVCVCGVCYEVPPLGIRSSLGEVQDFQNVITSEKMMKACFAFPFLYFLF